MVKTTQEVIRLMGGQSYVCDPELALVLYLALNLDKPLFLEGEAGVGKTEVAKALAKGLGRQLIRLQCYEGLDVNTALYEWNYPKQLLEIKRQEVDQGRARPLDDIFTPEFIIKRPLLRALEAGAEGKPVVLLIDELDRADEEFEAFLLELLSDFQVTIPEMGTISASTIPAVIITSNRTREVHDATKRRCLYHWIDYPSPEKEREILRARLPGLDEHLSLEVCQFMARVRRADFMKTPGVAETLDWAQALMLLHRDQLDEETVRETQGCLFKYRQDQERFQSACTSFFEED